MIGCLVTFFIEVQGRCARQDKGSPDDDDTPK